MSFGFKICLITDRHTVAAGSLELAVEEALAGGVDAVQLREKDLGGARLYELAVKMRRLTDRYGARLLINDRIDVALATGADGVQLPAASFPPATARKLLARPRLIGVSVHDQAQAQRAVAAGADFVVFGPVFATPSKRQYGAPQGMERLRSLTKVLGPRVVAVGGIDSAAAAQVIEAGAVAVACISAILARPDPRSAARELKAAVG